MSRQKRVARERRIEHEISYLLNAEHQSEEKIIERLRVVDGVDRHTAEMMLRKVKNRRW